MPVLYVLSGSDVGRTYEVVDGALLGRVSQCDVVLRDSSVSRTHARLERRGEGWVVVENGDVEDLVILEPYRTSEMYESLMRTHARSANPASSSYSPRTSAE